jgi:hypothetical protein
MKYATQMAQKAMIFVPSFIKISSALQKLFGGYTHRKVI